MLLRVIFMGTAPLACASLNALLHAPFASVVAVVTQPDRPKGRKLKLQPSAVKELASRRNLRVLQPERARDPALIAELAALAADLVVVAAYGQILPRSVLEMPRFGCINVHTSLLPKYRGAAPIQWAILNDESETGVTIMQMDAGLDTGAILTQERTPIAPVDTAQTLHDRLAALGADLLARTIPGYVSGEIRPRPQPPQGASYAPKIEKEMGRINWSQPARTIWNKVRGLVPWPGAFTSLPAPGGPALLKIWNAVVEAAAGAPGVVLSAGIEGLVVACGVGSLRITELQKEGGRRLAARDFLAGHPLAPGARLGSA